MSVAASARLLLNRAVVVASLACVLPAVVVAERVRPGGGRAVVLRAIRVVSRLCGVRYVVTGASRIDAASRYVFVPNHSSPADIPAVLIARRDVRFVAASELFRIPLLAGAMRALDTVAIDRRDPRAARRHLAELRDRAEATCVAIFAEGGIVPRGHRRPFRSGAFVLAIEAGALVVPVAISGADDVLPPRAKLGVRPGTIYVELLEPLPTDELTVADRKRLRDRTESALRGALAVR